MKTKLIFILSIFSPLVPLILLVGFFIFLDTAVGVYKAKKLKQKITSRKLSAVLYKMFIYQSIILSIFGIDHFIVNEIIFNYVGFSYGLTKAAALVLIHIESYSIDESIREFNNDKGIKYYVTRFYKNISSIKEMFNKVKK